ncbi:MAG: hypothetical protein U9Q15_02840 [Patescibacteria group bacterium]|nr:hypothetical protein [Patescibacteria group bacterium]
MKQFISFVIILSLSVVSWVPAVSAGDIPVELRPFATPICGSSTVDFVWPDDIDFADQTTGVEINSGEIPYFQAVPILQMVLNQLRMDYETCVSCAVSSLDVQPEELDPEELEVFTDKCGTEYTILSTTPAAIKEVKKTAITYKRTLDRICSEIIPRVRKVQTGSAQSYIALSTTQHKQLMNTCDIKVYQEYQLSRRMVSMYTQRIAIEEKYAIMYDSLQDIYHGLELVHETLSKIISLLKRWRQEQKILTREPKK